MNKDCDAGLALPLERRPGTAAMVRFTAYSLGVANYSGNRREVMGDPPKARQTGFGAST
jgi:hypothetical protein